MVFIGVGWRFYNKSLGRSAILGGVRSGAVSGAVLLSQIGSLLTKGVQMLVKVLVLVLLGSVCLVFVVVSWSVSGCVRKGEVNRVER